MAERPGSALAWVALGANLGDRHATLDAALQALAPLAEPGIDIVCSPRYESDAMPVPERPLESQPPYLNAVARLHTRLAPLQLLDALQSIENAAGRDRSAGRWAARTLDLDLLLFDDLQLEEERLRLPHPGIAERAFVLRPLADLDDALEIPGAGSVATLLARLAPGAIAALRPAASNAAGATL